MGEPALKVEIDSTVDPDNHVRDSHIRQNYRFFVTRPTRWDDNDHYGHMNNAVYYFYFDSTLCDYFTKLTDGTFMHSPVAAYVAHSQCNYRTSVCYPDKIEMALRINRIGRTSVQYGLAMFRQGDEQAAAHGTFTHVFVNRETGRPVPVPDDIRKNMLGYQL